MVYNGNMAEQVNFERVRFPKHGQRRFLETVFEKFSVQKSADVCNVSERTIRDWKREKFLITKQALSRLCKKSRVSMPTHVRLLAPYWYTSKGAKAGWKAVVKKYGRVPGNPEYRKRKWLEWWEREGKYKKDWGRITQPLTIRQPRYSEELAEFVGIILGDGGITDYQIKVSLNSKRERGYASFIETLIHNLFQVPITRRYRSYENHESSIDLVVSRVALVRFCIKKLGLVKGNKVKHQVGVPAWIKRNRKYLLACVRGLVDTDGSVYLHRYRVNGKWYTYSKLSFANRSMPLLQFVSSALRMFHMSPRLTKNKEDVRLDSKKDMQLYFTLIGSHNPWHLKKYKD